jgi:hypothetical protein
MLLYAGTASILSFKYFIFKDIVKKLKQWSLSAGNLTLKKETSETIRNNIEFHSENIKKISVHVPKHLKLLTDEQLGHYLAGLIDGNGYFSSKQRLVIELKFFDVSLAYYIKKRIGYGQVKKVKDKIYYLLIISNKDGLIKIINLVNGKLRNINKINQIINNILVHPSYSKENLILKKNQTNDLNNHWFAGFSDVSANFQIKFNKNSQIINSQESKLGFEIKLNLQITKEDNNILLLIKNYFGGHILYDKLNDKYIYNSDSLGSAKKLIDFFDKYHLQSSKYVNYLKWRKTYILIQNQLTEKSLTKINKLKNYLELKFNIR